MSSGTCRGCALRARPCTCERRSCAHGAQLCRSLLLEAGLLAAEHWRAGGLLPLRVGSSTTALALERGSALENLTLALQEFPHEGLFVPSGLVSAAPPDGTCTNMLHALLLDPRATLQVHVLRRECRVFALTEEAPPELHVRLRLRRGQCATPLHRWTHWWESTSDQGLVWTLGCMLLRLYTQRRLFTSSRPDSASLQAFMVQTEQHAALRSCAEAVGEAVGNGLPERTPPSPDVPLNVLELTSHAFETVPAGVGHVVMRCLRVIPHERIPLFELLRHDVFANGKAKAWSPPTRSSMRQAYLYREPRNSPHWRAVETVYDDDGGGVGECDSDGDTPIPGGAPWRRRRAVVPLQLLPSHRHPGQ